MSLAWSWYHFTNAASGALFITLGVLVLRLRRRERANAAFSLFTIAFGASFIALDLLATGSTWDSPRSTIETVGFVGYALCTFVAVLGLGRLALTFPAPLEREERTGVAVAAAIAVAAALLLAAPYVAAHPPLAAIRAAAAAETAIHGAMLGVSALFALRFPRTAGRERSANAIVAGAIVLYPAFYSGIVYGLGLIGRGPILYGGVFPDAAVLLGPPLLVAFLWLRASARAPSGEGRPARGVALLALVALLGGAVAVPSATASGDHWGYGAARVVGIVVLAYAIVRHQLLGIDVKVRRGISKSTVAAVFIAVFFVASEAAQQFLGDTTGSAYLGIAAAGALVFAIAPLQRVAERIAERAVPVTERPAPVDGAREILSPTSAEAAYLAALRAAARDGVLTRREEHHLAEVAEHLGIGAKRALELRERVETEVAK